MEGAVSKMFYKYGKRDMELSETITKNNLPDSFEAFYQDQHMDNTMKCKLDHLVIKKPDMNMSSSILELAG